MITLFIGLTAANLLSLTAVFVVGLVLKDGGGEPGSLYSIHITLGIIAGLLCALTHVTIFTYFMATTKWLGAATYKAALDHNQFVANSLQRKKHAFRLVMIAITTTTLTMIGGAGADSAAAPLWPPQVHLLLATVTIAVNFLCALSEYKLIAVQGRQIKEAASILYKRSDVKTKKT